MEAYLRNKMGDDPFEEAVYERYGQGPDALPMAEWPPWLLEKHLRKICGDEQFEADMTTRLVAAAQKVWLAWRRFGRGAQRAAAIAWHERERKLDRSHEEQTALNMEASRQQALVRQRARQAATSRVERPLTAPGPSHRAPEPKPVGLRVQTQDQLAREAVRQARSREEAIAHAERLQEKEALRVAQLREQHAARRKAQAIQRGDDPIAD